MSTIYQNYLAMTNTADNITVTKEKRKVRYVFWYRLFSTLIPLVVQSVFHHCDKDLAIIFTAGRLSDIIILGNKLPLNYV
jgi:hypothetical protein